MQTYLVKPFFFCLALALPHALTAGEPVAPRPAPVNPAQAKQAEEFVKLLASDSYSERARAKDGLLNLKRASIEPLEYAAQSTDPEVRMRAIEILTALRGVGFLGVQLQEEPGPLEEPDPDDNTPSRVKAAMIVNHEQYQRPPFPAEVAGVQAGDTLVAVNEHPVRKSVDLMREVGKAGPGRVISLTMERNGKPIRVAVMLTWNPTATRYEIVNGKVQPTPPAIDLESETPEPPPAKPQPESLPKR